VRDPDPVIFFEHKGLYPSKGEVPDGEITDELGRASVLRRGGDATILALAAMVPRALAAAGKLAAEDGIEATVVDVRSLVPLDTQTILAEVARTGRLFTVEENPRAMRLGRRDRLDRGRGGVRRADRPGRPHHHPAYPASGRG
jgi:pyruvate dehydrogenase E1 component beta subunit